MCTCAEAACGGGQATFAALGALVWPRLASAYIERRLAGLLPASDPKDPPAGALPHTEEFQRAARAAQRFEEAAARTGCMLDTLRPLCLRGVPGLLLSCGSQCVHALSKCGVCVTGNAICSLQTGQLSQHAFFHADPCLWMRRGGAASAPMCTMRWTSCSMRAGCRRASLPRSVHSCCGVDLLPLC